MLARYMGYHTLSKNKQNGLIFGKELIISLRKHSRFLPMLFLGLFLFGVGLGEDGAGGWDWFVCVCVLGGGGRVAPVLRAAGV